MTVSREDWNAAWLDKAAWRHLHAGYRSDAVPFLEACARVRATGKPSGPVHMHRVYEDLNRVDWPPGPSTWILVDTDGNCRTVTTRQSIGNHEGYRISLERRTECQAFRVTFRKRDLLASTSTIANKPIKAQLAFTARRASAAGDLI